MSNLRMALLVAAFSYSQFSCSLPANAAPDLTKVYLDNQPVLEMVDNQSGQTAAQRARVIQCQLDRALLSLGLIAPKITVAENEGCLSLQLNGFFICEADAASAAAAHMTVAELAASWAAHLQKALDNQVALNNISYETRQSTLATVLPGTQTIGGPAVQPRFVRLPEDMVLNAVLETTVHTAALRAGDGVVAMTTADLVLPSGEVLRRGTRIFGDLSPVNTDAMFGPAPLKLSFDRMQLPDGTQFPVAASLILGDQRLSSLVIKPGMDQTFPAGYAVKLQLDSPAQVAVTGTMQ